MSTRDVGKFDAILLAVVAQLKTALTLTDANCYLYLDPEATPEANPGQMIYVVGPDISGNFDAGNMDGGGAKVATLGTGIMVAIHSAPQLRDQQKRDTNFLTDSTLGIMEAWRKMVKALTVFSPGATDGDSGYTRDPLFPTAFYLKKRPERKRSPGAIITRFSLVFDLDLDS